MMVGVGVLRMIAGKLLVIGLLCMSLTSCTFGDKSTYLQDDFISTAEIIKIQIDSQHDSIPVQSMVSSYELVLLEASKQSILSNIDQLLLTDQYIIVSDSHQIDQIYAFNHDGSFSHSIGRKGRGPGEYIHPTDITIKDSCLVVLDMFSHQILYYEFGGKFLKSESYSDKIHEIEAYGAEILAYAGDNRHNRRIRNYEFLVLNADNTVKSAAFYNPYSMNYNTGKNINSIGDELYFSRALLPCVCEYDTRRGLYAKYVLELSPNPLPANFEQTCHGDYANFMNLYRGNYTYYSGIFWGTDRYLSFNVESRGKRYLFLKDKVTDASYLSPVEIRANYGTDKTMTNLIYWLANPYAVKENCIYSVVDSELLFLFDREPDSESNPAILKMYLK